MLSLDVPDVVCRLVSRCRGAVATWCCSVVVSTCRRVAVRYCRRVVAVRWCRRFAVRCGGVVVSLSCRPAVVSSCRITVLSHSICWALFLLIVLCYTKDIVTLKSLLFSNEGDSFWSDAFYWKLSNE